MKKALFLVFLVVCGGYLYFKSSQTASAFLESASLVNKTNLDQKINNLNSQIQEKPQAVRTTTSEPMVEEKLQIFEDIVLSKNDSDPRIDTQLKHLGEIKKSLHATVL